MIKRKIKVIDSHTGGEPTRVIIDGGPDLGTGSMAERLNKFHAEFDSIRSAVANEPRGSDVIVGAILCEPVNPTATTGVVFFNNVGFIGMCGHALIGVITSLAYLGRIGLGEYMIETPVGDVVATLHGEGQVSFDNVPSYRFKKAVCVHVDGIGKVCGDIVWGGNWFFLVSEYDESLSIDNVERLTDDSWRIRCALNAQNITGENGAEIDHIEFFGAPENEDCDSRNFVLCPGKAYDRSPCGTGTSAKLACLYADGKIQEGELWRQESIVGSVFEGRIKIYDGKIVPNIKGSAFVTAESTLILDPRDPFCMGIGK